ncbi:LytR/AlgR family response regulator transcription factor [Chitinimonas taiwanensis]|jgi:DNA-binding LytR/AlgR family response regulator|uniref:Two component transcriptional regulator, LytTR family n=1 Tax=Chitinimonas taiwanensis DSM 18899 TaxID=1121279 RepID=A0A1K2HFW9_9NEIS|nr:LytTR family DNA-binding domain-containing protein [Chitinimonas taiwanensis]SFZ75684.1 two component transcriptional regulator, LytTR family [Chitinimonas taiwanensis DSM 18899]
MQPTALIADDEPLLAEYLKQQLASLWPELQIAAVARNGLEAVAALHEHEPDVAFLDIKMPGLSGLEVARSANGCHCVFVTAYDQYAVEAFERDAIDYLLKPYSSERLQRAVHKLQDKLASQKPANNGALLESLRLALGGVTLNGGTQRLSWIRAGQGNEVKLIAVDDVCYFHAADKYTTVVTREGEYLIRTSLKELLEQLDNEQFWQVHRATLVNVREIAEASRDFTGKVTLSLKSRPESVAVSRAYAHLFKQM